MVRVILLRWVGREGEGQFFARRHILPCHPFARLGVQLVPGEVPEVVEEVWVSAAGELVAEVPSALLTNGADAAAHVAGWAPVGDALALDLSELDGDDHRARFALHCRETARGKSDAELARALDEVVVPTVARQLPEAELVREAAGRLRGKG
jgi:hypothetical protein